MEIIQNINNRTLLAYLLTTEVDFTFNNDYIKCDVDFLIDAEYIQNEEIKIAQITDDAERNKMNEILYKLKRNLENGNNL